MGATQTASGRDRYFPLLLVLEGLSLLVLVAGLIILLNPFGLLGSPAQESEPARFRAVEYVDQDRAYIGGVGTLLRWDGSSWNVMDPPTQRPIRDIAVDGATVWIAVSDAEHRGKIYRYDGESWTRDSPQQRGFIDIDVVDGTAWTTGHSHGGGGHGESLGRAGIFHRTDEGWESTLSGFRGEIATIAFRSNSDGYATATAGARGDFILRYDGDSWTNRSIPNGNQVMHLVDLALLPDGTMIGVGFPPRQNRSILLDTDGELRTVNAPTDERLYSIDAVGNQAWAVGGSSTLLQYTDEGWEQHTYEADDINLYDISMLDSGRGLVVGENRTVLRWNGTGLKRLDVP